MKGICFNVGVALVLAATVVNAAPPPRAAIDALAADYLAFRPATNFGASLTLDEALLAQRAFVRKLTARLGPPVGYKVGLVTRETQQRFGLDGPVRGVLLEKMLLENGAEVPAQYGVRPMFEADLIVVVKDKAINKARTPLDALRSLKEVAAFIELADSFVVTNPPVSGPMVVASNVGARLGVLGQRRALQPTPAFLDALAEMSITVTDQTGAELGKAPGKTILDHPLNAVLWLAEELRANGESLKAGDLISLGSVKNLTPQPGQTLTVRYDGLPGGPLSVAVKFK